MKTLNLLLPIVTIVLSVISIVFIGKIVELGGAGYK